QKPMAAGEDLLRCGGRRSNNTTFCHTAEPGWPRRLSSTYFLQKWNERVHGQSGSGWFTIFAARDSRLFLRTAHAHGAAYVEKRDRMHVNPAEQEAGLTRSPQKRSGTTGLLALRRTHTIETLGRVGRSGVGEFIVARQNFGRGAGRNPIRG